MIAWWLVRHNWLSLALNCAISLLIVVSLPKWGHRVWTTVEKEKVYVIQSGGCAVVVLGGTMRDGRLLGVDVSSMLLKASRCPRRLRKSRTPLSFWRF
jgi:hypothetical protein